MVSKLSQGCNPTEFRLIFSEGPRCELLETSFSHPLLPRPLKCNRGRNSDAKGEGTFGWTNAVKAIACLCIKHRIEGLRSKAGEVLANATHISGGRGSLAASLDYALSKEPIWLQEMFGLDGQGTPILKRILRRSNPELKRPGPTRVSISEGSLSPHAVRVFVGQRPVEEDAGLNELLKRFQGGSVESAFEVPQRGVAVSETVTLSNLASPERSVDQLLSQGSSFGLVQEQFVSEATWALRVPQIFSRDGYRTSLRQISEDPSFRNVCSSGNQLNVMSQRDLPTNVLQGLLTRELKEYCQRRGRPLRVGITPAQVASIAVLTNMQREGLDLEIDFGFSLGEDLVRQIRDEEGPLDGFVVTIASAAAIMAVEGSKFEPLSLMPKISHSVIRKSALASKTSKLLAGPLLMVSDAPSTPQFCLDSLIRRGIAVKKDVAIRYANPSDVTRKLMSDGSEEMTILGFPHYSLLDLVDGLSLVNCGGRDQMSKDAVLFVKRRISDDNKLALGLLGYLRGSWLSLAHNGPSLRSSIGALLSNGEYLRSLGLTIGAHHLVGDRYAAQYHK